ncbi:MAG: 2-nitropropane dioxygenase [Phenylobacterium sp.]|nr:2-nitropropane dioxygenase [Phenylobacterium sp.]
MSLPQALAQRLRLPLIAAPMFRFSTPRLAAACCKAGVIGSFPAANYPTAAKLEAAIEEMETELAAAPDVAPWACNLIIASGAQDEVLDVLVRQRVEIVITSVGSPRSVIGRLHDAGALVFADVGSLRHARLAAAAGADGLVLLSAGAGGQTGWVNSFAFVRAVRDWFDGVIVLAGGMSDGAALCAAEVLGVDLGYMGTRFIATTESAASDDYRNMLVDSSLDDILVTKALTGLQTSILRPALLRAGLDPATLDETVSPRTAKEIYGGGADGPRRWADLWSAGHSVSGVDRVQSVAELVSALTQDYEAAWAAARSRPRFADRTT